MTTRTSEQPVGVVWSSWLVAEQQQQQQLCTAAVLFVAYLERIANNLAVPDISLLCLARDPLQLCFLIPHGMRHMRQQHWHRAPATPCPEKPGLMAHRRYSSA